VFFFCGFAVLFRYFGLFFVWFCFAFGFFGWWFAGVYW